MVPEQPPRRSKVGKEPITIDLAAGEPDVVAEPIRSTDTDALPSVEPGNETLTATDGEPREDIADEPVAAHSVAGEPPLDDPLPGQTEPPQAADHEPEPRPVQPHRQIPSTPSMIAAGILGGLVALILAGSMQYAGYLPAVSPETAPVSATDTSALSSEIATLQQQIQVLQSPPASVDSSLADRIEKLEAGLSQGAQSDLPQRLAAIENQLKDVRTTTQETAGNDADLARRLQEAEAKINDKRPEQQVARAVAAAALKAAIDRGGSFETELRTFAGVAGDDPAVADLEKYGAAGVPSRGQLQRDFPQVADAMLEAAAQPDENQGLAGRLLSSAISIVKVRRVGDVQGDSPEAAVARMEEGLRNGDLAASAREWDSLPEPAKAASREFKQRLDARIQVENLVGSTLTRAVAGTQG